MTGLPVSLRTVDLDNCDKEPIQSPGSIQPHGALIALDLGGRQTHASRNISELFPGIALLGELHGTTGPWLDRVLQEATASMLKDARQEGDIPPLAMRLSLGEAQFDTVLNARGGRVMVEFEACSAAEDLSTFALFAQTSISRLKGRADLGPLLEETVVAIRRLTGFDRVMAYRFHLDDSGEVVAEAKVGLLDTYLGRRFPASDIPEQARRLYVLNTLRLIANVHDRQVPIDAVDVTQPTLDLSYSILRSVSPIHVEYLKNINVAASMSVSIVVDGRLWGLIACHHRAAHRVPYAVRMACDVLASVVSASVQLVTERSMAKRRAAAVELHTSLIALSAQDDQPPPLALLRTAIGRVIEHDNLIFAHGAVVTHDTIELDGAIELLKWLEPQPEELISMSTLDALPHSLQGMLGTSAGLLAVRHDRVNKGWLVLLRNEQKSTVTWSGAPDKVSRIGPLGSRLTPDGSLAEWEQDVRGSSRQWDKLDLSLARQVLHEVMQASAVRAAEMDQARAHLLAVMGHDLRGPLQLISMGAALIERGGDHIPVARKISAASSRMGRLISQVLDMSRLNGGLGLGLSLVPGDLVPLVGDLVGECRMAYPAASIEADLPTALIIPMDSDRIAQVIGNLLSNARQHGSRGTPTTVRLEKVQRNAVLQITNTASPISGSVLAALFEPLKQGSIGNPNNPHGLGLGLYISHEAVKGHGGTIAYSHDGDRVMFTVTLPCLELPIGKRATVLNES